MSHAAAAAPIGTVATVGLAPGLAQQLMRTRDCHLAWRDYPPDAQADASLTEGLLQSDAVLLGAELPQPLRWAQQVHRVDKAIPVLILSEPARDASLRREILYSGHLGTEVRPFPLDRLADLPEALLRAVERRHQRRRYIGMIESAQMHMGRLSLFQPEITHYLDRLLDRAPLGVLSVDAGGTILSVSRRAEAFFGVTQGELLGKPFEALFAAHELPRLQGLLGAVAQGGLAPAPAVLCVGRVREPATYLEATLAPLALRGTEPGAILMLQDVTERVAAERERERAERDLRAHVTVLSAFHRISSAAGPSLREKLRLMLEFGCRHLQTPFGLLMRSSGEDLDVVDAVTPDGAPAAGARLRQAESYYPLSCANTDPLCVDSASAQGFPAATIGGQRVEAYLGMRVMVHGGVYGTLCFASPTPRSHPFSGTDREMIKLIAQWAGGALQRESDEAQMRLLSGALEQAADSVMLTDAQGRIEYVNPAFERCTGYARHDVVGRIAYVARPGDAAHETLWRQLRSGEVFRGVLNARRRDGTEYLEETTISPLRDANGLVTHFIGTGHDVTQRALAEEAVRQHQTEMAHVARLSTLGEMTSGLAHELTQPLCAITTYAQTCLRVIKAGDAKPEQLEYGLEQVVKQAEIGGAIFRRLRNFARKGEQVRRDISLAELIREAVSLIQADLTQNQIELRCQGRGTPMVRVDPIQIEQVFINLMRNSIDAMAECERERRRLSIRHRCLGSAAVQVLISDHGPGCPAEIVSRLFQPFFTTKLHGLGIGLGISRTIIEAHGGTLQLHRTSARGTSFEFTLPMLEAVP